MLIKSLDQYIHTSYLFSVGGMLLQREDQLLLLLDDATPVLVLLASSLLQVHQRVGLYK